MCVTQISIHFKNSHRPGAFSHLFLLMLSRAFNANFFLLFFHFHSCCCCRVTSLISADESVSYRSPPLLLHHAARVILSLVQGTHALASIQIPWKLFDSHFVHVLLIFVWKEKNVALVRSSISHELGRYIEKHKQKSYTTCLGRFMTWLIIICAQVYKAEGAMGKIPEIITQPPL